MCIFLILVLEAYLWQHLPVRTEIVKLRMARKKQLHQIRVQEAILQAELINHDFYAFKNADEDCFSVLYLRKEGNWGIINIK